MEERISHAAALDAANSADSHAADSITVAGIFRSAWRRVPGNKWIAWKAVLLYLGTFLALSLAFRLIALLGGLHDDEFLSPLPGMLDELVMGLVLLPMSAGMWFIGVALARGLQPNPFSIFGWYEQTLKLLLVTILSHLMILLGLLLLVLPGIYLLVCYQIAAPLAVDKELGPWAAMERSRQIVGRCWFRVFALDLFFAAIVFLSVCLAGIPLVWAIPAIMISWGVLYERLVGVEDSTLRHTLYRARRSGLRRDDY